MRPRVVIHLDPTAFGGEPVCLGRQLAELLRAIETVHPELRWYGGDIQAIGPRSMSARKPTPVLLGSTEALVQAARAVEQFESGVFVGVSGSVSCPVFRAGGLWTEDEEDADLGDALIEVRAFDTSYWSIGTTDAKVVSQIGERFESPIT